ncbi:Endo-1,3(4)-beta-glucanase [Phytophthora megakarya]|uniref:glucan endo-1,3-beta-D-glucosidase n=1 Tax=Phytophthora megakarya TaxID=4795 RepID=A0A225X3I3_9STRA|nr:Endo-1,3(4)-beta-glucanase [Phytophthora megakarya]
MIIHQTTHSSKAPFASHRSWLLLAGLCFQLLFGGDTLVSAQNVSWDPSGKFPSPTLLVNATTEQATLCKPRHLDTMRSKPVPTNAWWGNLVTCDATTNATQPIWSNPFAVSVEDSGAYGFALSYPYRNRFFGGVTDGVAKYYAHPKRNEIQLTAYEFQSAIPDMQVINWTDLGVTVQLQAPSSTGTMKSSMVSGMAYFTTTYKGLTPEILFEAPIATINGATATIGTSYNGTKFNVLAVSGQQWWIHVFPLNSSSPGIQFNFATSMILQGLTTFNGTIRVSAILDPTQSTAQNTHSSCIVTGGDVEIANDSKYSFKWKTEGNCSNGLFHYAMDHHTKTLTAASVAEVLNVTMYSATRGLMKAFTTLTSPPTWSFYESRNIPVTHYPRSRLTTAIALQQDLKTKLRADIQSIWTVSTAGSYYFTGKLVQQYASLCLMANDPVIVGTDLSLLRRCVTKLESAITPFLDNSWKYPLKYDAVTGGVVSSEGFITGDANADFGNTVYNDHHYHYGYWVHMASVINYLHPTWSRIGDLNNMTRLLLRDVANPSRDDPYFPKFRGFDWFRGHSYSHGMTALGDGKDEESTSEDINFAYSMALFGQTTNHKLMKDIGRLLTKISARSIQTYFLFDKANTIHPEAYRPHMVTGILFDNKADYATWFSADEYMIHGIQMLPVTPVLEYVRTSTFIQQEWDTILSKLDIVARDQQSNSWYSLLYLNYARVNKAQALLKLSQCSSMMDGLSRSWALYMAAQFSL